MAKEMLINVSEGEECRIALLEDGKLEELYMERTSSTSHVGNIYKGRVTNVESSIQAAFVDFGLGRNGFLHISDLMPSYFGRKGEDIQETVGRKMARRDRPPIQRCLRRGDEIVVQIIKEGIGTKGPTLTTYLSIPGKILVMMPGVGKSGVSRKIEDEDERRRLRQILDQLDPPDDAGFILRTAGIGATKAEIQRDLTYLARLWVNFKKKRDSGPSPMELYTEGDLVTRTVRDVFTSDVTKLVVDNKEVAKRIKEVVKLSNPRTRNKVELYEEPIPLFHKYGIEKEIEMMYSRHVPLPSGGSLVIDSTEAIVAIDVNSGKNRIHSDAETTAFKVDMEAADEICRQLKLRDLGGVIICDFIDLRYERHRHELERRLNENLKQDRAKTKVLRMSQFGIIEMTRQRMRPSFKRSVYFDCPHCKGAGLIKTPESMSLDVMRRLRIGINDQRVQRVELAVCPDVAFYLQNKKRQSISELEEGTQKRIVIRSEPALGLDEMKIDLFDTRDGLVFLEELGMVPQPPHTTQLGTRPAHVPPRGRPGGRDDRSRGRPLPPPRREPPRRDEESPDERFERVDEDMDDREREAHREPPLRRGQPAGRGHDAQRSTIPAGQSDLDAGGDSGEIPEPAGSGEQTAAGNGSEGGGRRRRRRRGRRGRGRNRQNGENRPLTDAGQIELPQGHLEESGRQPSYLDEGELPADAGSRIPAEDIEVASEHSDESVEIADAPEAAEERSGGETLAEEPAEERAEEPTEEAVPAKPRRRRRGGRGRGRKPPAKANAAPEDAPAVEPPAAPEVQTPIVRTGSTDRHLIEDEPVVPHAGRRLRSPRDLDHIPDDFD